MPLRILTSKDPDFEGRLDALTKRAAALPAEIEAAARQVIADVRARGDDPVRASTQKLEQRAPPSLELPRAEWQAAAAQVDPAVRTALDRAAARIRAFHQREQHPGFEIEEDGIRLGLR